MRILKKSLWPHQVTLKSALDKNQDPRVAWLKERMPLDNYYVLGPNRYAFKRQEDAVLFSLRWGS